MWDFSLLGILFHAKEKEKSNMPTRNRIPFLTYHPINHERYTQKDVCLPHSAMKQKELRKAFALDSKKPQNRQNVLLQRIPVLRMHDPRQPQSRRPALHYSDVKTETHRG